MENALKPRKNNANKKGNPLFHLKKQKITPSYLSIP
jgi:hypothetical protein